MREAVVRRWEVQVLASQRSFCLEHNGPGQRNFLLVVQPVLYEAVHLVGSWAPYLCP